MLKGIRLKFGPNLDSEPVGVKPGPMTVIVGPNNSGKSLTLQELYSSFVNADATWASPRWRILADVEPDLPPFGERREWILEAIGNDLSSLRASAPPEMTALRGLKMLLGEIEMEDELLEDPSIWLKTIRSMNIAVSGLIQYKKLRRPASSPYNLQRTSFEALKARLKPKHITLLDCFEGDDFAMMELIRTVNNRSDQELIDAGIVDFHGYLSFYQSACALLDGTARLGLAREESASLSPGADGTIMRLWQARPDLERLRAWILDAFGQHLCVNLLNLGRASLVLSSRPPPPGIEERLDPEAQKFFAAASPLGDFSDGVRTYIGLHAELIAQTRQFIMIDEPEAFLHPPLARRLGFNLSTLAAERGSCVFAATHSPDFLMGCIESGVGVNIIRLGYHNGVASAHLLPRDELETMMVDPLLRSTGILGALFHQAAVVVEGDSDRAFYSEINERLRIHEPGTHPAVMRDCVFVNAQGKATVSRILDALRRLGVVSCGIVDLDLLKDNGVCKKLLEARGATEAVAESIGNTRASIQRSITDLKALCLPNGLARATDPERRSVRHFIHEMALHGIFLPEAGPVEGWLSRLAVKAHKNAWIPAIFKAMGPVNTGLKPSPDDVWRFIRRIGAYLEAQGARTDLPDPEANPSPAA